MKLVSLVKLRPVLLECKIMPFLESLLDHIFSLYCVIGSQSKQMEPGSLICSQSAHSHTQLHFPKEKSAVKHTKIA